MLRATSIPRPANELLRSAEASRYALLGETQEGELDFMAQLAAELCHTPYAQITLVVCDQVQIKGSYGTPKMTVARNESYCAWVLLQNSELFIDDLRLDPRTQHMLPTLSRRGFRMFGGVNLTSRSGYKIGVLCVLDNQPRTLTASQRELLAQLAQLVGSVMALELQEGPSHLAHGMSTFKRTSAP